MFLPFNKKKKKKTWHKQGHLALLMQSEVRLTHQKYQMKLLSPHKAALWSNFSSLCCEI